MDCIRMKYGLFYQAILLRFSSVLFLFVVLCAKIDNVPLVSSDVQKSMILLHRYGYLKSSPEPTGAPHNIGSQMLDPPEGYHSAISTFQHKYNLSVTGNLDQPTIQLLHSPRCGNPDVDRFENNPFKDKSNTTGKFLIRSKRYLIEDPQAKWRSKTVTWQIRKYPSNSLSRARTHAVFQHTFNLWSRVIDLDFAEETDYKRDADILISFAVSKHEDSIPFDGKDGVLAHAFYPNMYSGYSLAGDAHFDDDETWNDGPHQTYRNLVSVAAHEIGHSLGLGHSDVPTSIMYPYYLSSWEKVKFDQDDINGIQSLYGAAKAGKYIPPGPELPDIPPPPPLEPDHEKEKEKIIDFCNTNIDAIIKIRNLELHIFKDSWQWRVTWSKTVTTWISYQFRDGPANLTYYWPALAGYVDHVDAGIERDDSAVYIFQGNRFWLLQDNKRTIAGFPPSGLPLTALGLPSHLTKVDTMFRWDENNAIYIFAGEQYWKLDSSAQPFGQVISRPDYPRRIVDTWHGVPTPTQAALTDLHGETLFFSDAKYYAFDNIAMRVRSGYPKLSMLPILGCFENS